MAYPNRVTVEIKGGLGNQMFQYAAARELSLNLSAELILEKRLGFILDKRYERKFELNGLPTIFSESNFINSIPLLIHRFKSFLIRKFGSLEPHVNSNQKIFERNFDFLEFDSSATSQKCLWLSGYFQDPRYFQSHTEIILDELTPPTPNDQSYIEIAKLSEKNSLVALGIRVFEESPSPAAHARGGKVKTIVDYLEVLKVALNEISNPIILVFTTKEFDFLSSLNFPAETIFVNSDRGFDDTLANLWLLSMCQHHIFNNSTFYWWGAALSRNNFKDLTQQIYCADNFLNPNIGYSHWKSF